MGRSHGLSLLAAAVLWAAASPCTAGLIDSPWPGFRHDSLHTGRSASPGPVGGSLGWTRAIGGSGAASPAVGPDCIYAVGGGDLLAVSSAGTVLWSATCGNTGASSPSIAAHGTIYVASTDSYLYAFNPDGTLKWKRSAQGTTSASPTVDSDGTVYIGASSGKFTAYQSSGVLKYTYTAGGSITSSAAIASDGTVYFGCNDGNLYALTSTGALKWKFAVSPMGTIRCSPSIGSDGTIYFGASNGSFYAVRSNGTQRWVKLVGGPVTSSPATGSDGAIYFGCQDGYVYCLNSIGTLRWRYQTGGYVDSSPAIDSEGRIYVGSNDGTLYAFNSDGTLAWSTSLGAAVISSPAIGSGNTLYVATYAGDLCSFCTDTTPPPAPQITDDGEWSTSATTLHASWSCNDPESGISRYEYAIRDSQATEVVPFTDAGTATEVTRSDLQLTSGATYYFAVRATNGAGLVGEEALSDGIRVDLTPPTVTSLSVSPSLQEFRARVSAIDAESGVAQVQCALLTSPQLPDSPNWVEGVPDQDVVLAGPLDPAAMYYVAARALSGAGAWSGVTISEGYRVDSTPPTTPVVADDGAYSSDATSLHASWTADDPESGIDHYSYCVGTTSGSANALAWADTTQTSATITGLSLVSGSTYFVSVKATNRAGLTSPAGASDGIVIDSTPPSQPVVLDDGETTSSPDCLHATIAASDAESGIAGYQYCIGVSAGADDLVAWTTVNQNSITATGLQLEEGKRYYFTARAVNGAGLLSAAGSSDGIEYRPGTSAWTKYRSDVRNTGCAAVQAPMTGRLSWRVQTQGYIESSAATGPDGTAYIGSGDGKLYAISSVGTVKWTYDTATCIDSSPAIAPDGSIYAGSYDGLNCINPDGTLKWKCLTNAMVWSSPAIDTSGAVYFGCHNRRLYALNADGSAKWVYTAGGSIWSSPAIGADGSVYFGCGDGKLYAVASDGKPQWSYQTGSAVDSSPAVAEDGTIYFGSGDGFLYAIRPWGALRWRYDLGQVIDSSAAVTSDGRIYVGTGGAGQAGSLYAFSADGSKLWQFSTSGGVKSSPAVDEHGNVCFGSTNGKLYLVNRDGVELWSYATGDSIVSSPAFGGGGSIVVGSDDGGVYCFRDLGVLDTTPPTTPVVHAAPQFISSSDALTATWSASDPESGIRSYAYAVGTQPATGDVVSWTEIGTATSVSRQNLPLLAGRSYYVSVKATNHAMLQSEAGVSEAVTVVAGDPANTIGGAKKSLAGTQVNLPGKVVTAVFDDCVFIEEPDRSSGIRCVGSPSTGLQTGTVVSVTGLVGSRYGETVLTSATITPAGFTGSVAPLALPCDTFGRVGLDATGMLVRVAGKVTRTGTGFFVLYDGSYLLAPRGGLGMEVQLTSGSIPDSGTYTAVTGIACRELVGSRIATVIRAVVGMEVMAYPGP